MTSTTLLSRLNSIGDPKWINEFFNLIQKVIEIGNLDEDDPRLALTLVKGGKRYIRVNLGSRIVLSSEFKKGALVFSMIFPASKEEWVRSLPGFMEEVDVHRFTGEPESILAWFSVKEESYKRDNVLQEWEQSLRENSKRKHSTPHREKHVPELFQMAVNKDFRDNTIKEAMEGNFEIENSGENFDEILDRFLAQAQTDDLKVKGKYPKEFEGLEIKVSFGQGNLSRIPWIALLKGENKVSDGIYPVLLYYKDHDLLVLAYGISETNTPSEKWDIENVQTISEYFSSKGLGKPDRYGKSYVFKTYKVNSLPSGDELNGDIEDIISAYLGQETSITGSVGEFNSKEFQVALSNAGLLFDQKLVTRFCASLLTKPFVILTGLSGSGKTKLAQSFAKWICKEDSQFCIVPVGADWTNREPLLGYPNALNPTEYIKPDNGALELIQQANNKKELPFFLILDEMNLSHVERYFADFLSAMESKEAIPLHDQKENKNGVSKELMLPPNLFVIGTVNIDETTNMFSPKVLDRANSIEFRVNAEQIGEFLNQPPNLNMKKLEKEGADMAMEFTDMARKKHSNKSFNSSLKSELVHFFKQLQKLGAEFGYRSASEILLLIEKLGNLDPALTENEKIDIAIMQKLLPKLHGARRRLCPVLEELGKLCLNNTELNIEKDVFDKPDFDFQQSESVKYSLSLEKVARMYRNAVANGFASYAEA